VDFVLDITAMPLWRFKAGDSSAPLEIATGIRPEGLTADSVFDQPTSIELESLEIGKWYILIISGY
jgi:hypothetical protein